MNKLSKLLILLAIIAMLAGCFAACEPSNNHEHNYVEGKCECGAEDPNYVPPHTHSYTNGVCDCGESDPNHAHSFVKGKCACGATDPNYKEEIEFIDYASQVKFNPDSGRIYAYVTVKSYIDGDTTHFDVKSIHGGSGDGISDEFVKARYLAINTPESTGVIEPWGKKASNYTKTQLQKATDIIIESDTDTWNLDSTGSRYLLWVWYKTAEDTDYRNLNLEILQQGLAFGSSVSSNSYSTYASPALTQAMNLKLHVFSKAKDPDFYYGGAVSVTLKELKANCEKYEGKLVKFEAVVAKQIGPTVYVEEYDAATDMYFGMQIYCGFGYQRMGDFTIGNRVSIVGTLQYYENGGTYQVSNLQFDILDPQWQGGCTVIGSGYSASYREGSVADIMNGKITLEVITEVENEDGEMEEVRAEQEFDYGELAHYSTVSLKNLTVQRVTTTNNGGDSDGALSIYCVDENGNRITVRTADKLVWKVDGVDTVVVATDFPAGTVISVRGIIDSFKGDYQIKVFNMNDIIFE